MVQVYSYRKKNYKRFFLILFAVFLTVVGGYYTFQQLLSERLPKEETTPIAKTNDEPQALAATAQEAFRYGESALFQVTYHYNCGHKRTEERKIPLSFIDKTFQQLTEENPGYEFLESTQDKLIANVIIPEQCDDHYIIKLSGDKLRVYYKKNPEAVEREVTINLGDLYEEDIAILENGIEVGSKIELLEFLEDFAN